MNQKNLSQQVEKEGVKVPPAFPDVSHKMQPFVTFSMGKYCIIKNPGLPLAQAGRRWAIGGPRGLGQGGHATGTPDAGTDIEHQA